MQRPVFFRDTTAYYFCLSRRVNALLLAVALCVSLLTVCGCHDVKGAAKGTAGQLNTREQRDKDAIDILDSAPKRHPN